MGASVNPEILLNADKTQDPPLKTEPLEHVTTVEADSVAEVISATSPRVVALSASAIGLLAACGGTADDGTTSADVRATDPNGNVGGSSSSSSSSGGSNSSSSSGSSSSGSSSSGSSSSSSSGTSQSITEAQASRFLSQAALAATSEEITNVKFLGYPTWIDQSFSMTTSTSNWDWLMARGYSKDDYRYRSSPSDYAVWHRLITAPDQLRQRVALALSEYFVVSAEGLSSQWVSFSMAAYWDLLCQHAFGNFRTLLEAITLNPAMGMYLSARGNQKENPTTGRAPDENYAREIMQLFTIGLYELNTDGTLKKNGSGKPIETYNQDTITNLARVFTGWDVDTTTSNSTDPTQYRLPMRLIPERHSTLESNFLGATVPAGTDGKTALRIALDTLFNHPNVGPFFGRQLIQRLVTSNPTPGFVARVAAVFNNNGSGVRGDLKAVIRAVLLDDEARKTLGGNIAQWGKLREPMLRMIQWARTFKAASTSSEWKIGDLSDPAKRLGQSPLRSPSVFNYFRPGYTPPNSAVAKAGLVAPEFQIANEPSVAGYLNFMQSVIASGISDVQPNYNAELQVAGDASALVKRLNLLLAANQLSPATETRIIAAIESISASNSSGPLNRVRAAIMLIMASPEYLVLK